MYFSERNFLSQRTSLNLTGSVKQICQTYVGSLKCSKSCIILKLYFHYIPPDFKSSFWPVLANRVNAKQDVMLATSYKTKVDNKSSSSYNNLSVCAAVCVLCFEDLDLLETLFKITRGFPENP